MKNKPNILVIITDQQQRDLMSCAGNKWVNTPNLDALASDGLRFTNAYCSDPICTSSRFSMFSGMYPNFIGLKGNDFKKEVTEPIPQIIFDNGVAKLLNENGYKSYYGGKEQFPFFKAEDLGFEHLTKDERDELADLAIEKIERSKEDEPFFMVTSFIDPHDICLYAIGDFGEQSNDFIDQILPKVCTKELEEIAKAKELAKQWSEEEFYKSICPPLPENYMPSEDEPEAISIMQAKRSFKQLARANYTDKDWRMHRWVYARFVEIVDAQIGRVIGALKTKGIYDNTVIIFTSDHGDLDASHKMEHKTALYKESTQVPLILKDINGTKGISDLLVSSGIDMVPTILDFAGIEKPSYMVGESVKGFIEKSIEERQHLKIESEFGKMIAMKDCAYHFYEVGERNEQFYDRITNPHEMFNQIEDEAFTDKINSCRLFLSKNICK